MSKSSKIITGILSFLPLAAFVAYFIFFFTFIFSTFSHIATTQGQNPPDESFLNNFMAIFGIMAVLIVFSMIALIYFIVHAANNKKMDNNERIVWILIIIFVGMLGFPVYWYMKIWKEEEEKTPVQGF